MIHRTQVAVVGAGLCGLVAAWELLKEGREVLLIERQSRIGGRIQSALVDDGVWVELGGAYVASFHSSLLRICAELGVSLRSLSLAGSCLGEPIQILSHGRCLPESRAVRILRDLEDLANRAIDMATGTTIDSSMAQVDVHEFASNGYKSPLVASYFSDLPRGAQSAWALLALIRGAGGASFFAEAEAYYAPGGMTQLVTRLGNAIGNDRILTGCTLRYVTSSSRQIELLVATSAGHRQVHADVVVLAVPRRALLGLRQGWQATDRIGALTKNREIAVYGRSRAPKLALPPLLLNDGAVCRARVRPASGDRQALSVHLTVRAQHPESRAPGAVLHRSVADLVWPSLLSDEAIYEFDWSSLSGIGGSYGAFRPGQLADEHAEIIQLGRVLIAGDLVVPRFAGYMEGAVRSGVAAAARAIILTSPTPAGGA